MTDKKGGALTSRWKMKRFDRNRMLEMEDWIAVEHPLTIMLNGDEFATMVCSPSHLDELVVGFLASEGVIRTREEIRSLTLTTDGNFAHVELVNRQRIGIEQYTKRMIGSCCGKSRQFYFQNDARTAKTVMSEMEISMAQCFDLMETLQTESVEFAQTGGLHNAALCTAAQLLVSRTDIGRHNALDKLFGYCLQHKLSVHDKVLVFSGRLSSEVLLKAAKIGVGIVLTKSAPTDLALKLADDLRISTVGFIRGERGNIYTHPFRIVDTR